MVKKIAFFLLMSLSGISASQLILANDKAFGFSEDTAKVRTVKAPLRVFNAVHLDGVKPIIDGDLNDECWKNCKWDGDFTQWVPLEGGKPAFATIMTVLFDEKNIYVAIRAYDDNPDKISIKKGRRDEMSGDVIGVCFDSYHDHRTGFEFDVTASGQKIDCIATNPLNADCNWNAVWYTHTKIDSLGWTAEMEIPLSQLRYSNAEEQVWGFHCWRWIERFQEESDWEPQSFTGPGILYLFGELHGIKNLPRNRRFELMPYALGKVNTYPRDPKNVFLAKGRETFTNFGLDAKIGVSSNFTADLTINPDFGQVESDPSVMNLSAFEQFFTEKRPFFLEGKNIFSYDFDDATLFYSRRIGHAPSYTPGDQDNVYFKSKDKTRILSAVKFSGKSSDGLSIGVLQSFTANEDVKISGPEGLSRQLAEPFSNYMVGRIQKDYDQSNTVIGGMLTSVNRFLNAPHLNFLVKNAYTGGLDLLHQWHDKEFFVDAKFIGSTLAGDNKAIYDLQNASARYFQRPDAGRCVDSALTSLSGWGGRIKIGKGSKGFLRYASEVNFRSPGLELNDIGFMNTADIVKQTSSVSYFVNKPVSIFRTYSIGIYQNNNWNFEMKHLSTGGGVDLYLEFLNKWAISNSFSMTSPKLDSYLLRGGSAMMVPASLSESFYWRTDWARNVSFDFNCFFANSMHAARNLSFRPGISVRPYNALRISMSVSYSKNIDKLQYVDKKTVNGVNSYVLSRIDQQTVSATFRVDYNVTTNLSLQYYGSPFATIGKYSEFKSVVNPLASALENRYLSLDAVLNADGGYFIDEYHDQKRTYNLDNPDFNFYQFRSNFVLRWEYRPGSQLYLVWSSERTFSEHTGYDLGNAYRKLTDAFPSNVFLIKFNYWFSI